MFAIAPLLGAGAGSVFTPRTGIVPGTKGRRSLIETLSEQLQVVPDPPWHQKGRHFGQGRLHLPVSLLSGSLGLVKIGCGHETPLLPPQ